MLPKGTKRRRCVVLADGTTIGSYQRNTHETHTVVLEPSGHTYTYLHPDGTRSRHLSPTALSSHRALVVDTVNIRNRFTAKQPYLHLRLLNPKDVRYQRRMRKPRARWPDPRNSEKLQVSRLFNTEEGCFEMQSIEGAAKVRLHASGKIVELFYLVEVKVSDDEVDDESSHAYYTTLHQSFGVEQVPDNFELPVCTLLTAKAARDKDEEAEIEYVALEKTTGANVAVSELPRNSAFTARPAFCAITTTGTQAGVAVGGGLDLAEVLRVSSLPSKMLYRRVVAEVVGDEASFFVSHKPSTALPDIVIQLSRQRSLLTGCDGFFSWYDENGRRRHQFTRETIPPTSAIDIKNTDAVPELCQHVEYLLSAFRYAIDGNTKPLLHPESDEIELAEEVENDSGRFRAFRDGRVRVVFTDRTILRVDRDGQCCSFFLPDGSTNQTTLSSAPLHQRTYIYQALEFGDWAFASQEERMERHHKRQEAQAVVSRELQRINVRCGMNSKQQKPKYYDSKAPVDQQHKQPLVSSDSIDPSMMLSLAAIQELQSATLQHIASVDRVLQAAALAAADTL